MQDYVDGNAIQTEVHTIDGQRLLTWLSRTHNRIGEWHKTGLEYNSSVPHKYPLDLIYYIDKLAYHNYEIWDMTKPIINQAHSDTIKIIDNLFIQHEQLHNTTTYNDETMGSLINRIIIIQLKLYHLIELDQTGCKYLSRLNALFDQHQFLKTQTAQLLSQMQSGERHI